MFPAHLTYSGAPLVRNQITITTKDVIHTPPTVQIQSNDWPEKQENKDFAEIKNEPQDLKTVCNNIKLCIEEQEVNVPKSIVKNRKYLYNCEHCAYKTDWKSNLSKHILSRHTDADKIPWSQCPHCPYKGKTKQHLKSHLMINHNESNRNFRCTKCRLRFLAESSLKNHLDKMHPAVKVIQWFQCTHCDFKCQTKQSLRNHMNNLHVADKVRYYACPDCPYLSIWASNIRKHRRSIHQLEPTKKRPIPRKMLQCQYCSVTYKKAEFLKTHIEKLHKSFVISSESKFVEIPVVVDKQLAWRKIVVDKTYDGVYDCAQCTFRTRLKSEFEKHFVVGHDRSEAVEAFVYNNNIALFTKCLTFS